MGRCGLINSGGESKGASDLAEAVRTAVINKRGGGMGLISGRKAFQRPMNEGIELLNAIQDVYLSIAITIASFRCCIKPRALNRSALPTIMRALVPLLIYVDSNSVPS